MRSLAIFEVDGALDSCPRAVAVAKQALRDPEWGIAIVTGRSSTRSIETLAYLAARVKAASAPKTAPTYWCGDEINSGAAKTATLKSLLRQHYDLERLVCFESDAAVLASYDSVIRQLGSPRSFTLYHVEGTKHHALYGNVVFTNKDDK